MVRDRHAQTVVMLASAHGPVPGFAPLAPVRVDVGVNVVCAPLQAEDGFAYWPSREDAISCQDFRVTLTGEDRLPLTSGQEIGVHDLVLEATQVTARARFCGDPCKTAQPHLCPRPSVPPSLRTTTSWRFATFSVPNGRIQRAAALSWSRSSERRRQLGTDPRSSTTSQCPYWVYWDVGGWGEWLYRGTCWLTVFLCVSQGGDCISWDPVRSHHLVPAVGHRGDG